MVGAPSDAQPPLKLWERDLLCLLVVVALTTLADQAEPALDHPQPSRPLQPISCTVGFALGFFRFGSVFVLAVHAELCTTRRLCFIPDRAPCPKIAIL